MMRKLQSMGCHNINWVTPTPYVAMLVEALALAIPKGLHIPIVYNTGGYDSLEVIALLDGIVDIYMPDFKFWDVEKGRRYLHCDDYPEVARQVLGEMHRQVGNLVLDAQGVARRGLLVRHLVMPGCLDDTHAILGFLAREISPDTWVNIMAQYRPGAILDGYPELERTITGEEYARALDLARQVGLTHAGDL